MTTNFFLSLSLVRLFHQICFTLPFKFFFSLIPLESCFDSRFSSLIPEMGEVEERTILISVISQADDEKNKNPLLLSIFIWISHFWLSIPFSLLRTTNEPKKPMTHNDVTKQREAVWLSLSWELGKGPFSCIYK